MTLKIRRIVTSQIPGLSAHIFSDAEVPNVHQFTEGGIVNVDIWRTYETPSRLRSDFEEPAAGPMELLPPAGGHVFRITEFPPDPVEGVDASAAAALFANMRATDAVVAGTESHSDPRMHRTETLDYGIVLEGNIVLVVGAQETLLGPGDVVVQRGSDHAWANRSGTVCRMAFFMNSAKYPDTLKID